MSKNIAPTATLEELAVGHPRRSISLRRNFSWSIAGNVAYAGCQWGMLVVLAKLGDPVMVGQFSLALSLAAPVFMFTGLNTRALQASDARRDFAFGDYLGLRLLTTLVGLALVAAMTTTTGDESATQAILLLVALAKGVEAVSDVFHGSLQQQERMRPIAISMMLRGSLSLLALGVGVVWGGGLWAGVVGLVVVWTLLLVAYDVPQVAGGERAIPRWDARKLGRLFVLALPLGVVLFLIALNVSLPRLFVKRESGLRELGIFTALSYLMVAGSTVVNALGQAATPRLALLINSGDRRRFLRLLGKLLLLGVGIGVAGVLVAWIGGDPLLTLLYRPEYAEHSGLFVWLMAAAGLGYVASFLGYGMTAARFLRIQVVLFAVVCAATSLGCWLWVPTLKLEGAALALVLANGVQLVGSAGILWFGMIRQRTMP
jgi:O-antigen/teichoic acid export membrane protein